MPIQTASGGGKTKGGSTHLPDAQTTTGGSPVVAVSRTTLSVGGEAMSIDGQAGEMRTSALVVSSLIIQLSAEAITVPSVYTTAGETFTSDVGNNMVVADGTTLSLRGQITALHAK